MGRESRSAGPSHSDQRSWQASRDKWLDDFQRRYKARFRPGLVQLRLSRIFGGMKISADALFQRFEERRPYLSLTMSSANDTNRYLKKIVLTPARNTVKMCTPSFEIGWLRLKVEIAYDWATSDWNLSYRAKTKWSQGSRITHKFQHLQSERFGVSTSWTLKQGLPQIGGSLGSHQQPRLEPDIGKFLLEFNRLKACYML